MSSYETAGKSLARHATEHAEKLVEFAHDNLTVDKVMALVGGAVLYCALHDLKDGNKLTAAAEFGAGLFIANTNMFKSGASQH